MDFAIFNTNPNDKLMEFTNFSNESSKSRLNATLNGDIKSCIVKKKL